MHEVITDRFQKGKLKTNNLSVVFNKLKCSSDKVISIELCPGRALNNETLEYLSPEFCSIIWSSQSDDVLKKILEIPAIKLSKQLSVHGNHVLLHLAGRQLSKAQVIDILMELQQINVRNIFVMQGEPSHLNKDKSDFRYASDLIKFIKKYFGNYFSIGVAAYPEGHVSSPNKTDDLKYLKLKVDAGADFIITQMVFNFKTFNDFLIECKEIGIDIPIIPGVTVINSYESLTQMVTFCRVEIPESIKSVLMDNRKNPEAVRNYGIFHCRRLVNQLLLINNTQIVGVHFFSLNKIKLVRQICKMLGLCDVTIEKPLNYYRS